jgi:uncharacterized integral membrane protein (TIGR00697 family)
MQRVQASSALVVLAAVFVTVLITSNLIAVKLVDFGGGWVLPAAIVVFPLSYLLGDVLTEVYGYGVTRRIIWLGFLCNLVFVLFATAAVQLPAAVPDIQQPFGRVLGQTPRILAASFIAYLVGEFANAFVLAKMKIFTRGRWLWTRTVGSTLIGQGLDSAVFITLAFAGTGGLPLVPIVLRQWAFKTGYEVLATPLTYAVVTWLKRLEQQDHYDRATDFNPLALAKLD